MGSEVGVPEAAKRAERVPSGRFLPPKKHARAACSYFPNSFSTKFAESLEVRLETFACYQRKLEKERLLQDAPQCASVLTPPPRTLVVVGTLSPLHALTQSR